MGNGTLSQVGFTQGAVSRTKYSSVVSGPAALAYGPHPRVHAMLPTPLLFAVHAAAAAARFSFNVVLLSWGGCTHVLGYVPCRIPMYRVSSIAFVVCTEGFTKY